RGDADEALHRARGGRCALRFPLHRRRALDHGRADLDRRRLVGPLAVPYYWGKKRGRRGVPAPRRLLPPRRSLLRAEGDPDRERKVRTGDALLRILRTLSGVEHEDRGRPEELEAAVRVERLAVDG